MNMPEIIEFPLVNSVKEDISLVGRVKLSEIVQLLPRTYFSNIRLDEIEFDVALRQAPDEAEEIICIPTRAFTAHEVNGLLGELSPRPDFAPDIVDVHDDWQRLMYPNEEDEKLVEKHKNKYPLEWEIFSRFAPPLIRLYEGNIIKVHQRYFPAELIGLLLSEYKNTTSRFIQWRERYNFGGIRMYSLISAYLKEHPEFTISQLCSDGVPREGAKYNDRCIFADDDFGYVFTDYHGEIIERGKIQRVKGDVYRLRPSFENDFSVRNLIPAIQIRKVTEEFTFTFETLTGSDVERYNPLLGYWFVSLFAKHPLNEYWKTGRLENKGPSQLIGPAQEALMSLVYRKSVMKENALVEGLFAYASGH